AVREIRAEVDVRRLEVVDDLNAIRLQLLLDHRERKYAELVAGRRLELERKPGAAAGIDSIAAQLATMRRDQLLRFRRVVIPGLEMVDVLWLVVQVDHIPERGEARVERRKDGLHERCS